MKKCSKICTSLGLTLSLFVPESTGMSALARNAASIDVNSAFNNLAQPTETYGRQPGQPSSNATDSKFRQTPPKYGIDSIDTQMMHFEKAPSRPKDEDVAGVIINDNKIIYVSSDKKYYEEPLDPQNSPFKDVSFFEKYKKLLGVSINCASITDELLDSMYKIIPETIMQFGFETESLTSSTASIITKILGKLKKLTSIKARIYQRDPNTENQIFETIATLKEIRSIDFAFYSVTKVNAATLTKILESSANELQYLTLSFTDIDKDEGILQGITQSLRKCKVLKELNISAIELTSAYANNLFDMVGELTTLEELTFYIGSTASIDGNAFFDASRTFAKSLSTLKALKYLDLSRMQLPTESMQLILKSVADLVNLKMFNISHNKIDEIAASHLANILKNCNQLKLLVMANCELSPIFPKISDALSRSQVGYLYIGNNSLKGLVKSLNMKSMNKVSLIDLSFNEVPYMDTLDLIQQSMGHQTLKIVNMEGNLPPEKAQEAQIIAKRNEIEIAQMKEQGCHTAFIGLPIQGDSTTRADRDQKQGGDPQGSRPPRH